MGRMNVAVIRYMEQEHFRVLIAVCSFIFFCTHLIMFNYKLSSISDI